MLRGSLNVLKCAKILPAGPKARPGGSKITPGSRKEKIYPYPDLAPSDSKYSPAGIGYGYMLRLRKTTLNPVPTLRFEFSSGRLGLGMGICCALLRRKKEKKEEEEERGEADTAVGL